MLPTFPPFAFVFFFFFYSLTNIHSLSFFFFYYFVFFSFLDSFSIINSNRMLCVCWKLRRPCTLSVSCVQTPDAPRLWVLSRGEGRKRSESLLQLRVLQIQLPWSFHTRSHPDDEQRPHSNPGGFLQLSQGKSRVDHRDPKRGTNATVGLRVPPPLSFGANSPPFRPRSPFRGHPLKITQISRVFYFFK